MCVFDYSHIRLAGYFHAGFINKYYLITMGKSCPMENV